MSGRKIAGVLCFLVFLIILLHQFIVYGVLIEFKDMCHHEFFAFIFLTFGAGLLLGGELD